MKKTAAFTGKVRGTVQGVFFRAATARKAEELGLRGWVRNEPDGSVAFLVAGEDEALEAMHLWLQSGPPSARVLSVGWLACDDPGGNDFEVRA